MIIQTRRNVLAGGAALAAAALPLPPARAAAPPIGKQVPGFYRYKVGSFEVTAILDGMRSWPLEAVRNVPKEQVSAALAAAYLDSDKVTFPYVAVVVNTVLSSSPSTPASVKVFMRRPRVLWDSSIPISRLRVSTAMPSTR
jgi:hypothetical protein